MSHHGERLIHPAVDQSPKRWPRKRFKYLSEVSKLRNGTSGERDMLSVSQYRGIVPKDYEAEHLKRTSEELTNYLVVRPEQLVLNTMWLNHRGLGVSDIEGVVSPAYRVYSLADNLVPRFVHHLLRSDAFVDLYKRLGYGIRPNSLQVSVEDFGNLLLPLPPVETQRAIADFLDRKTAAIDALIEKKERLIALLQEKRQALITQAVTKGLDPSVPMKDSGIEWLGEIPAHWEVKRLRHLVADRCAGPYGSSLTKAMYSHSGYRVYGQQQVIPGDFSRGDYYIDDAKFAAMRRYAVQPGDLLVTVMGTIGRAAIVPVDAEAGIINPRLVRYRLRDDAVLPEYVAWSFRSSPSIEQLGLMAQGSTMDGLNMTLLADLSLAVPPRSSQTELVAELARQVGSLDGTIERASRSIALVREYRQALITAAVTGQVDVTKEAA